MLADFATFRVANMIAFDKINMPHWELFFIGAAISALGLIIGRLLAARNPPLPEWRRSPLGQDPKEKSGASSSALFSV